MNHAEIKKAVNEALEEERKKFWVDSKTHYQHHEFIGGWIWGMGIAKKSIIIAFVAGLAAGLLSIIWIGFQVVMKVKGGVNSLNS